MRCSMKLCECGCEQEVKRRFIKGHQIRVSNPAKNPEVALKISAWHKGRHLSEEQKQKISNALKGIITWNKGLTKESDPRIALMAGKTSKALKGRMRPEEESRKAAASNRGKKRSEEARRNISIGHLGQPGWNTGLKGCYSQQRINQMRLRMLGSQIHKGYKHSIEVREAHSRRMKALWADKNSPFNREVFSKRMKALWANKDSVYNAEGFLQRRAQAQRWSPNKRESKLIELIERNNLPFRYVGDGSLWIERRNPDFINTDGKKQLVELFGDYWHADDDSQSRIEIYAKYGFETLIIWEHELKEPHKVLVKIKEFAE